MLSLIIQYKQKLVLLVFFTVVYFNEVSLNLLYVPIKFSHISIKLNRFFFSFNGAKLSQAGIRDAVGFLLVLLPRGTHLKCFSLIHLLLWLSAWLDSIPPKSSSSSALHQLFPQFCIMASLMPAWLSFAPLAIPWKPWI